MKRSVLLIAAASLACLVYASPALAVGEWMHNGSLMHMSEGHNFTIVYQDPKPGIQAVGVREGTVLFYGNEYGNKRVEGTAFVFKRGCQGAPYSVSGRFSGDYETLVLNGPAPVFDPSSCRVVGYRQNKNSHLVFINAGD